MEEFKSILCNICIHVKSEQTFRILEETTKDVLDILLLKGPIELNTSVICNACYVGVFEAFRFKTMCLNTRDCILPYVNSKNAAPVDLKEIYLKDKGVEHLRHVLENKKICRLCMQIVTSGFTPVKDIEIDLIRTCISEQNFYYTADPVVCMDCFESLKTHGNFLKSCFGAQKFEGVCEDEVVDDQFFIKTEEIDIK